MKISFLGMLALIFITLKLTGHIAWSWIWVLAPLWGGFALGFFFWFIAAVIIAITALGESKKIIRRP